jgi:cysteinyl-tRNA synthetase
MQLGKDKMSKSSGNLVTVKEILSKHSADALRLLVLSSYYRKPLNFSEESLEAMERGAERLTRSAREKSKNGEEMALDLESYRQKFIEFMDDDFNTSGAMATLFDLAREINRGREEGLNISRAQETLLELAEVLGLKLEEGEASEEGLAKSLIELLIQLRSELRAEKKWQLADTIRSRLGELGIVLEDSSEGTTWHSLKQRL